MTSDPRTHGRLMWPVFAFGWVVIALWNVADGEPFWWRVAVPVGMGVFSIVQYVLSRRPAAGGLRNSGAD